MTSNYLGVYGGKIIIGIPTYGTTIANISDKVGKDGIKGLGQGVIEGKKAYVLAGDIDPKNCGSAQYPCTGKFSYQYIYNNLLPHGFNGKEGIKNEIGSAAYADEWFPF